MKRTICYQESKASGLMLGMVFGNALGAFFNDKNPNDIPPLDTDFFQQNPLRYYTADIQTALSVLEEMGENSQIDQMSLQQRFIKRFSPWRGYAGGLLEVINKWKDGIPIAVAAGQIYNGTGNFGDGAAVRSGPISLFFRENEFTELFEQVTRNALMTHTHPYGIAGAQLLASAVLLALNGFTAEAWLEPIFKLPLESAFKIKLGQVVCCLEDSMSHSECARLIGNGAEAIEAVPAALFAAIKHSDSVVDAVGCAISMGGDTDTIAAMTGAIVGAYHGIDGIPVHYLQNVEKNNEGIEFIEKLITKYRREK